MNLIIATVLFGGIFTLYGLPEVTTKASSVSECVDVKQAGQSTAAECTPDMPVCIDAAGLRPGERPDVGRGDPGVHLGRRAGRDPQQPRQADDDRAVRDGQPVTVQAEPMVS